MGGGRSARAVLLVAFGVLFLLGAARGQEDEELYAAVQAALVSLADASLGLNDWVGLALETGKFFLFQ